MSDSQKHVEVPLTLVLELAEHHKDYAVRFYDRGNTPAGDMHHSYARALNDATDRDWALVGDDGSADTTKEDYE